MKTDFKKHTINARFIRKCTIRCLINSGHLTPEEGEAVYEASELLSAHYFDQSRGIPKRFYYARDKHTTSLKSPLITENPLLHSLLKKGKCQKIWKLYCEIILKNNYTLLNLIRRKPKLHEDLVDLLKELQEVIKAHKQKKMYG